MTTQPSQKARFITIEGIEGAGKSTVVGFIEQFLKYHQCQYIVTREPGGTDIAEELRQILLKPRKEKLTQIAELLLMFAARSQNIEHVIKPALAANTWVICDRFTDATFAYQGGGRQISMAHITELARWVQADLQPDCTLLLDLPVKIGLARAKRRGRPDRFENEKLQFFERVREAYLQLAEQSPERYRLIDATLSLKHVHERIDDELTQLITA